MSNRRHPAARFGRVPAWRYRLKRLLRVRRTTIDGFRVLAYRPDIPKHVSSLLVRGDYESPERSAINALLMPPHDRVLEIGTCIGIVAMNAARIVGSDNVLCYEPNPAAAAVAAENFAANGFRIALRHRAVAAAAGELKLAIAAGSWLGSSTRRSFADGRTLAVAADAIVTIQDAFAPSVVVIDAEGMEGEILRSLRLAALRAIVVEFHADVLGAAECAALRRLIGAHGFAVQRSLSAATTEVWLRGEAAR